MNVSSLEQILESLSTAFERANVSSQIHKHYSIAGHSLKLSFAGHALIDLLTSALEHLEILSSDSPSFTICLFDTQSTGSSPECIPSNAENGGWYREQGSMQAYFPEGSSHFYLRDRQKNIGYFWTRDVTHLPQYTKSGPLVPFFHWWLSDFDHHIVHAACVANENGAALLTGNGGAGKSTTAFACLDSPLKFLADDRCLVQIKPKPYVHALFSSSKLDAETFQRFPGLRIPGAALTPPANGDLQLLMYRICPQKIATRSPLKAIVSLKRSDGKESYLSRIEPTKLLLDFAPSSILRLPGGRTNAFRALSKIVRRVPSYRLHAGSNLEEIPQILNQLLNESLFR